MAMMKKFREEVIRINEIVDIYTVLSEMIDVLVENLTSKANVR